MRNIEAKEMRRLEEVCQICIYIYTYIEMCICMHVYVYIACIYIHVRRAAGLPDISLCVCI